MLAARRKTKILVFSKLNELNLLTRLKILSVYDRANRHFLTVKYSKSKAHRILSKFRFHQNSGIQSGALVRSALRNMVKIQKY